jgi:hypothetical protein
VLERNYRSIEILYVFIECLSFSAGKRGLVSSGYEAWTPASIEASTTVTVRELV